MPPEQACGPFVQRLVAEQGQRLHAQKAGVLAGKDAEAVHDARVASRRMRSALYFFAPWLPKQPTTRVRKRVRTAASILGAVRDLDVSLIFVRTWAPTLAPAAEKPLVQHLRGQRQAARASLLAFYEQDGYARLRQALAEFAAANLSATPPLAQVLPGLIRQAGAEVALYFDTLQPAPPVEHLHALRISVKYYRYLLEFTRKRASLAIDPLVQGLTAMQDLLGDLHDADVGCHLAYSLLRQPDLAFTAAQRAALLAYGSGLAAQRDRLVAAFLAEEAAVSPWAAWRLLPESELLAQALALLTSDPSVSARDA